MDISSISNLLEVSRYKGTSGASKITTNRNDSFEAIFQSALDMVNETNDLSNAAEEEEMNYALGISDNTHDLQVAQQKANISLQYTVAVRNAVLEAYKEILNLQF